MKIKLIILAVLSFAEFGFTQVVTEEWVQRYDGPGNGSDGALSIATDQSGNVYVTGWSLGNGTGFDYATIKYNSEGVLQWVQRYNGPANGDDFAHSLVLDKFGNIYVTGSSDGGSVGSQDMDYATIKYSPEGIEQWVRRYDGPNTQDTPISIAVDTSGNVYVSGRSLESGSEFDFDFATIKYDSNGAEIWIQRYDGSGSDDVSSMATDLAGNVYVTGSTDGGSGRDYYTIKYNTDGFEQWAKRYNGPDSSNDIPTSIAVDNSGNVYVTGSSEIGPTFFDCTTIKYSPDGTELWVNTYNNTGTGVNAGSAIAVDDFGNIFVGAWSEGNGTNIDFATIKYSSGGTELWVQRYNGPGNQWDWPFDITTDPSGNVYVTGYSTGDSTTDRDYATIKYSESDSVVAWSNPFGGIFSDTSNWVGGTVPDTSQTALFDSAYYTSAFHLQGIESQPITITFDNAPNTWGLFIRQSQVIFDLQAHSYGVKDISVGSSQASFPHESQLEILNGALGTTAQVLGSMGIGTLGNRGEVIVGSGGILEVESDGPGASLEIGVWGNCGGAECGRLVIQDGGIVYTNHSRHAQSTIGGVGGQGSVFISGNGSEWVDSTLVVVGEQGGTGLLDINNSGRFIGNALWLAFLDDAQGTIAVSNPGSYIELSDELLMGLGANSEGHLIISNGASGIIDKGIQIAVFNNSQCDVTVAGVSSTGISSSLAISDTTFIGKLGSGGLSVIGGGNMFSGTTVIPGDWGGIGSALVDGDSSEWNVSGTLWIGQRGVGFVRVTNQGTLRTDAMQIGPLGSIEASGGNLYIGGNPAQSSLSKIAANKPQTMGITTGGSVYVDTLLLSAGAQILADSVIFGEGGYLGSEDTLSFDIINSGSINPGDSLNTPGILTVDANYTQLSNGKLFIELGGLMPGNGYDQLMISGDAQLAGTLDVSAITNFEPQVGQAFQILLAGSISGNFEQIVTHGALGVDVTYNANSVTITVTSPLAIDEPESGPSIPASYSLRQNYPNPFNPSTTITFQLPQSEFVTLKVFDLNGREVATLVNRQITAGNHTINFNASQLASGVYFYRLDAGKFQQTRKMLLVR